MSETPKDKASSTALVASRLSALIPRPRRRAFYDSPGMLEQSHVWGGAVIWTIAAGTTAALLWAFLGKVDQTVVASGTLEPQLGKVEVRSPSGGIVRGLFVKEGQLVTRGTRLATVENLGLQARLLTTRKQLALLRYENALFRELLAEQDRFTLLNTLPPPSLIADDDKTRAIQLTVDQSASQLRQLKARFRSGQITLRLKKDLLAAVKMLYDNGGYAKFSYLSQADEVQQREAELIQIQEQMATVISNAGRQVANNNRQMLDLEAQLTGLSEGSRNLNLIATTSGRVFNLQVGKGSVIGGGSEVMRIIPEGSLRAKLYLSNADVGFVRQDQPVKIAVSSFPAGEYGYLNGVVSRIGADAYEGSESSSAQQRANTFPMIVSLPLSDNKTKIALMNRLQPGMQVSANIIVRQRPVVSLLTDVFTQSRDSLKNSR